ncbi:MAG: type II CAAX endopeptidase family protein [Brachymonas sp.]|nr:type II CAAX endopeptidase family protein [Brachymonas sp.]
MPLSNPAPASPWRTRLVPGHLLPRGRFAWWYFALALLLLALGVVGLGFVEYVLSVWAEHSPWQHASVLLYAPLFIATALLTPWLASRRLEATDFPAPQGLLGWRMGVVIGITITIQIVVNVFEVVVPGARAASEEVALSLGLGESVISDVALVLAVAMLAALGEEWLFRGLLFRSLRDGLARWLPLPVTSGIGMVASSALFAVVHVGDGQITQWPALFLMGVLLALAYEWTGSLLVPMLVHALNNTLALFVMLEVPGVELSSPWLLGLAGASPLMVLVLGRFLLCRLPAAKPTDPSSPAAVPNQAQMAVASEASLAPPPLPQPATPPAAADWPPDVPPSAPPSAPTPPPAANR